MKKHNGVRPQDIVILLKIVAKGGQIWYVKGSASEVSESLNRSMQAGLDKIREVILGNLEYSYGAGDLIG